jgi:hypothetical protein
MNTGGPAFPFGTAFSGMTLRDYFAAKALQSYLSDLCFSIDDDRDIYFKEAAEISYQVADAMLKAREQ